MLQAFGHRWLEYDDLDRLKHAGSALYGGDHHYYFTYDALDNLKSAKLAGVKDYAEYYYQPGSNRLTNILNNAGATVVGLDYDLQGNVRNKNGTLHTFDYGNRLREAAKPGAAERYRYDGHGRRVLASRIDGPADQLGAIFSQYASSGQLMYQQNERPAVNRKIDQIYLGGSLIAQREEPFAGGTAVVKYQHTDALGSPVAVTAQNGTVIERMNYEPYGGVVGGATKDGPGYTGHVLDVTTSLNYMQQRYYDPEIGRFLSVDPVTADGNTGGNFNRYWYANNNPYMFTDPDGRQSVPFGVTPQNAEKLKFQGQVAPMRAAGERAGAAAVLERSAIKAVGTASMGTGINAEKTLAGNSPDQVGWVPVGQGAFAGVVAEFKAISINLFDGATDSPFSFEASGDIGLIGSIGGEISLDPGGQLDISVNLGLGMGAHTSFSPTLNVDVNKQPEPPPPPKEELRNK